MLSENIFKIHLVTRENLKKFLLELTPEQLAFIPKGFNNNIWWNIAHCIASEQILCYKLSGISTFISEEFIDTYKKGTQPSGKVPSLSEIETLKELLPKTSLILKDNYNKGIFKTFTPYLTSYGFELNSIEDAIVMCNIHETMHLGTIKALKYFV